MKKKKKINEESVYKVVMKKEKIGLEGCLSS